MGRREGEEGEVTMMSLAGRDGSAVVVPHVTRPHEGVVRDERACSIRVPTGEAVVGDSRVGPGEVEEVGGWRRAD